MAPFKATILQLLKNKKIISIYLFFVNVIILAFKCKDKVSQPSYPGDFFKEPKFRDTNEKLCDSQARNRVVILVPSRIKDYEKRIIIRTSWANVNSYNVKPEWNYTLAFTVGLPKDPIDERILEVEKKLWKDIVNLNLNDDYYTLTVQTLLSFEWAHQYCNGSTKYIYKVDDDAYIHLASIENFIEQHQKPKDDLNLDHSFTNQSHKNATEWQPIYGGFCYLRKPVFREGDKDKEYVRKWIVTEQEYSSDYFPPFCEGGFYFFSYSLAPQISQNCPQHCIRPTNKEPASNNCFWKFEDAFMGSCMNEFEPNLNIVNITNYIDMNARTYVDAMKPSSVYVHPLKNATKIMELHSYQQSIPLEDLQNLVTTLSNSFAKQLVNEVN